MGGHGEVGLQNDVKNSIYWLAVTNTVPSKNCGCVRRVVSTGEPLALPSESNVSNENGAVGKGNCEWRVL